jgi:ribosomal-protein-alanine N-acetyltransferase
MSAKILETERLILRPMLEEDGPTIVRWRNAEHVAGVSHQSNTADLTLEKHLSWFQSTRESRVDYVIELKNEHHPIGSLSYTWRTLPNHGKVAEIGKYLGEPEALGKGYGSEATKAWIEYGFKELNLDCIVSRTRNDNAANIRTNEKLGFIIQAWPPELEKFGEGWIFMKLEKCNFRGEGES